MKTSEVSNQTLSGKVAGLKSTLKKGVLFILTTIIRHITVVLKTPTRIGDRIIDSKNIHDLMDGNAWFPAPDPTMADFKLLIGKYEDAATAVKAGAPDATAKLDEAWEELNTARKLLHNYVQGICVKNPEQAAEIALSAGMSVKKPPTRDVQDFAVKAIAAGGAELSAKVKAPYCAHEWNCSKNPADAMSWYQMIIPSTLQGKTLVTGLTSGERVYFRHRTITKDGPADWDQIVSIVIP